MIGETQDRYLRKKAASFKAMKKREFRQKYGVP
ncbi:hypothetical protein L905_17965 [Agrobacterium sp. TS43]|nr:hypothetical protein L906_20060 [Agrobacterium sp. TS45]KVK66394.1 hypothetical protein L905_17965 [Agrobacterium sp. TS43]KVK66924.1 hypothetical protein L907_20035 [Agrobacterium sp. C13]